MRVPLYGACPGCGLNAFPPVPGKKYPELVEPGARRYLFLLVTLATALIIGADLVIRQFSPSTGLWAWAVRGWPVTHISWVWHFFVVCSVAVSLAAVIIRFVFRMNAKDAAYIECPSCGRLPRG